eukprot:TRINITY_DN1105_c0_g1_i1.p1 TRINITY_DN1105_c0_g1~~TRINITY_DN1105_c0_g1_i1.p1  ORF type:complete len:262 (-),score=44.59 TRINITY_DN1105_c0_g1_i1:86-871(-)
MDVPIQPFENQVAGHLGVGFEPIMYGKNLIYKPMQSGSRGDREYFFYENILKKNIPHFEKFTPKYYGTETVQLNEREVSYILLEDLTLGIPPKTLTICDIKMGVNTFDMLASEKKRLLEEAKAKGTTTKSHGFRICGGKIYEGEERGIVKYDKNWGKKLSAETLPHAIKTLMNRKHHLVPVIIEKLKEMLEWFEQNYQYVFTGTSVLIVFNGGEVSGADVENIKVKIIDFAHVCEITEKGTRDEGYIFGLQNLIKCFEQLL